MRLLSRISPGVYKDLFSFLQLAFFCNTKTNYHTGKSGHNLFVKHFTGKSKFIIYTSCLYCTHLVCFDIPLNSYKGGKIDNY